MIKKKIKSFLERFNFDGDRWIQAIYFVSVTITVLIFCIIGYKAGIFAYFFIGILSGISCLVADEQRDFLRLMCGWIYYYLFPEKL
jgi:hypothetical protein